MTLNSPFAVPDQNTTQPGDQYNVVLTDIFSENKLIWQTAQPSFLSCLKKDMDDFITQNNITLYSKILTAPRRDDTVDRFFLSEIPILFTTLYCQY